VADPIDIGDDWEAEPVDHDPFATATGEAGSQSPGSAPQGLGAIAAQPAPASPSSAGQAPLDPQDRDTMIRTIAGEAGGEGPQGQAAIAHTILNRVADGGYGDGIQGVAQAPVKPGSSYHQFSVWNPPGVAESSATTHNLKSSDPQYSSIGDIVDKVHSGLIPDPTNGATHYYAPRSMPGGKAPPWAASLAKDNSVKIGNQIFLGRSKGPGQTIPSQVVGGPDDDGAGVT
jgi:spore germination cell wall hydrolase CwlJ-like protein